MSQAPAIGINLGTTYSCVGVWQNNKVTIIENDQGNRTTPSVVAFTPSERLVGEAAVNQALRNHATTVFYAKRLIGRKFDDKEVQRDMASLPFRVVPGKDNRPMVEVSQGKETKAFYPEEISAMVLGKMKQVAERFLNLSVKDAVITVPAHFNDLQRQAAKAAGKIAGLNVLRIINEPTVAGLVYGFGQGQKGGAGAGGKPQTVLVFDWGGGMLDIWILRIEGDTYTVLAVAEDSHLGGLDFDRGLADHFAEVFRKTTGENVKNNRKAMMRLRSAAERAKRVLSSCLETTVDVESLANGPDFSATISRAKLENLADAFFARALKLVKRCLKDARLNPKHLTNVVLVGGTGACMPRVRQMLKEVAGMEPLHSINPDEAIARGAALQAAKLSG